MRGLQAEAGRVIGLEPGQPEYRVLIVEDEAENWIVLERLLRNAGFQVKVAENGEQAVEDFRAWRPHFIWMDLLMPKLDGIEATRRIRGLPRGREVKIAAVTASGFTTSREEVLAAGLDDYLCKPYRPEDIFECMARHLGLQYRRVDATPLPTGEPGEELGIEELAALPAGLRVGLRESVVALDMGRISDAIRRVAERDSTLGAVLERLAGRYSYTAMLNAIDLADNRSAAETPGP